MFRSTIAVCAAAFFVLAPGICAAQNHQVTIRFVPSDSAHPKAKCVGVTSKPVLTVRSGETIKWKLKKDDDDPCRDFDPQQVKLRFESDKVVSEDGTNGTSEVKGHHGNLFHSDSADATVIAVSIGTSRYKYEVFFGKELAADPELEVTGGLPPVSVKKQ